MKRRLGIAFLALVVLLGSAAAGSRPEPKYSFRIRPTAKGVELECVRGCSWKSLAAECPAAPCEFQVDESGIK